MKTIKNTPFPSGPQDPFARLEVLKRPEGTAVPPGPNLGVTHRPHIPADWTPAQAISGPQAKPDQDLGQIGRAHV